MSSDNPTLGATIDDRSVERKLVLPHWLWLRVHEVSTKVGLKKSRFIRSAIEAFLIDEKRWWNDELNVDEKIQDVVDRSTMRRRIANLEAALERVLKHARGDGREATSSEHQMTMRTAQAILEDKLPGK